MNLITRAIEIAGLSNLSRAVGIRHQSVREWEERGRLPRSEFTGETQYAAAIAKVTGGAVSKRELLDWSRDQWSRAA